MVIPDIVSNVFSSGVLGTNRPYQFAGQVTNSLLIKLLINVRLRVNQYIVVRLMTRWKIPPIRYIIY